MKNRLLTLLLLVAIPLLNAHSAAIEVSSVQKEVGGTVTDVVGAGVDDNFGTAAAVGSYAVFDMQKDDVDYADLKVTYFSDNGSIGSNVMINQTSNSQDLTDDGTISILLSSPGAGSGTFQFDWFTTGSFVGGTQQGGSSPLSQKILYTTFDIDWEQFVAMDNSVLDYYALNSTTALTADSAEDPGMTRIEDNTSTGTTFTDPEFAAQFMSTDSSTHQIEMGKLNNYNGTALYMFEFRDPTSVLPGFDPVETTVPEPTSVAMSALVLTAAFWIRRRFIS